MIITHGSACNLDTALYLYQDIIMCIWRVRKWAKQTIDFRNIHTATTPEVAEKENIFIRVYTCSLFFN